MQNNEANAVDVAAAEGAASETATPDVAPRQRLPRRADLAQLLDAKLVEETETKETPRAPDAWLERRLRVFERQMSAMESRQDQVEKNARTAAAAAEDAVKALEATVAELTRRADAAEAKAKAAANELRTSLNEAVLRLQTVEGVAQAALAENHSVEMPEITPPALPMEESSPEPQSPSSADATGADAAALPEPPKSYLAEVRKSVAAATAAAEESSNAEKKKTIKSRLGLTRYFLGSLIVLAIFAAGAGVAFSKGLSDGRREATKPHAAPMRFGVAAATPLDRLAARAEAGDAAAELAVGLRYLGGAQQDPARAFHWVTLAAIHGHPLAQYRLALLYANGTGTPKDDTHALQWYEAAALQGNRKAMHDLAIAYAQGHGTVRNPAEAARWFSRAAGYGYVDSQFDLAVLYERGEGVPQSLLDAYKWYAVAGRQGDNESKERLEALRTQLSSDDLAAAEHAAQSFKAAPYDLTANVLGL